MLWNVIIVAAKILEIKEILQCHDIVDLVNLLKTGIYDCENSDC